MSRREDTAETIAFIGLGNMGAPMASRLVDAGYRVQGFDLSEQALQRLTAAGGHAATTAVEAARGADVVILMLPNSNIVESAVNGEAGILNALEPGATIVDMSSSEPLRTRALAEKIADSGVRVVDAPVSGGVKGAASGKLAIMVGGTNEEFAAIERLFRPLGTATHVGPLGAGHALKAINNLMSAAHLWVSSEAMLTGIAFGLDPKVMLDVINASSGRSGSTQLKWPEFIVPETYDSGFGLSLLLKDTRIATGLAESLGIPHSLSDATVAHLTQADADLGPMADHTEVARWLREFGAAGLRAS